MSVLNALSRLFVVVVVLAYSIFLFSGPKATNIPSERWYVSMHETLFDQFMRESDRKYSTSTDAVTKRLEDIDTRVAEVERQTNDKLQYISNLLEQIRDRNKPVKE
jgi:hypothetical protein